MFPLQRAVKAFEGGHLNAEGKKSSFYIQPAFHFFAARGDKFEWCIRPEGDQAIIGGKKLRIPCQAGENKKSEKCSLFHGFKIKNPGQVNP